ncbi:hypothetical protein DBR17_14365, partial [Sphingomonas sp. HMWF008]
MILATLVLSTTAGPVAVPAMSAPADLASADQATEQAAPPPEKKVLPLTFGPYPPGWQIDFGPGILAVPEFPGSDNLRILPIPQLDIRYKNQFFASVQSGIGYNLVNTRKLRVGPIVRPEFGRRSRDVAAFPGLRPIGFTAEAG